MVRILCAAVLLVGCVGSSLDVRTWSPEELRTATAPQLCNAFNGGACTAVGLCKSDLDPEIETEIRRRGLIGDDEWGLIQSRTIRIGMSACGVYASWGPPEDLNITAGDWGHHVQLVYGHRAQRQYVYIENGRVTSWQD